MNELFCTKVLAAAAIVVFIAGCGKSVDQSHQGWSPPVTVSASFAGPELHHWQDTLVGIDLLEGESAQVLVLNRTTGSWSAKQVPELPNDDGWLRVWLAAGIDPETGRIVLPGGYAENERLLMKAFFGKLAEDGSLRGTVERAWLTDKKVLLGGTPTNVTLNNPIGPSRGHNRSGAIVAKAIVNDLETIIPFTFDAVTFTPPNTVSNGPYCGGVFRSRDSGETWQFEKVSDQSGGVPALCQTTGYLYYFAGPYPLSFSRKAPDAQTWERLGPIAKTSHGPGRFAATGDGDTAHICWMDRRHNKWRFDIEGPTPVNCDIYYRQRKDGDTEWDKEVWLSKGLTYCYAPTIAAEGGKVVVVWAAIRDGGRWPKGEPNDIYFVTSKDGGTTWTRPFKVTDGAKGRASAGMPQVALLNGTIHLFYIQAATEFSRRDPWPLYYTQCPFPP